MRFIQPRIKRSIDHAHAFLKDQDIRSAPIDPFEVARKMGWRTVAVSHLVEQTGYTREELLHGKDGNTFWNAETDRYVIVYDDSIRSPQRIRWTITHEIGHIVLGHLEEFAETGISRLSLPLNIYQALEKEANTFATEFLAPLGLLHILNCVREAFISAFFGLSGIAAQYRAKEIPEQLSNENYNHSLDFCRSHFKSFIEKMGDQQNRELKKSIPTRKSLTNVCSAVIRYIKLSDVTFLEEVDNVTNIDYISLDQNERFTKCPRCGNDQFSDHAKYCRLCGLGLFNRCQNFSGDPLEECGRPNPIDARYCEYCGFRTYLVDAKILDRVEQDPFRETTRQSAATIDDPSSDGFDFSNITDDDLPF